MRLETAVTERDKKLLYGAGLAAAVLLYGVFALSPALQAHAAAARERRQAADRRGQMQAAAGEAAARESERKAAAAAVREAARDAYPLLSSEELDTLVTGLALDSGLQPLALTIGAATAPDLQGYALSAYGDRTLPPAGTGGLQAVALQGTAQGDICGVCRAARRPCRQLPGAAAAQLHGQRIGLAHRRGRRRNPGGVPLRADRLHV